MYYVICALTCHYCKKNIFTERSVNRVNIVVSPCVKLCDTKPN